MSSEFKGYNGNHNLKKGGVQIDWTPDLVQEYLKCSQDPVYFCETYMKIINVDEGLIPFEMYEYQKEMITSMADNRYTIITTARQTGKCVEGNTKIEIKFLDSGWAKLSIGTVHEISLFINNYRLRWLQEDDYNVFRKQVYIYLSSIDEEEAKVFDRLWREASHTAKVAWGKQLNEKSSYVDTERALCGTSTSYENVNEKNQRAQISSLCFMDDVSYSRKNACQEFKNLSKTKGRESFVLKNGYDWRKKPFLRQTARSSSEGDVRQETFGLEQDKDIIYDEIALVKSGKQSTTHFSNEYFGCSQASQLKQNWDHANRRIKSVEKPELKTEVYNTRTSLEREASLRGAKKENIRNGERAPEVRGNKGKNESSLGPEESSKKFIESFNLTGFYTTSIDGVVPISQSHKTIEYDVWELVTETKTLNAADMHIVFLKNGVQKFLKDLMLCDEIITDTGIEKIISVTKTARSVNMYDLGINHEQHRYYTNGILSHNSTTTCGFILWYILFHSEKTVALLANKGDTAREILSKIQLAYEHLPKWLQQGVREWNKGSFELENNSRVIATATSGNNIRGYAINLLFIDEAAFIANWEEFFTSVLPTISSGKSTKIVLVSTPNGLNHFHKLWTGANDGTNNFNPIKVMWSEVPGRDENWKKDTLAAMGNDTEKFNQEHCCEFLGSSGTLIAGWKLKELTFRLPRLAGDGVSQYEAPVPDNKYVMICDVSRGKGLDYSAFQLIDTTAMPYRQVMVYRNNLISPIDYAEVIHRIAKTYNNAAILVESNDIGQQVADTIYQEYEYENILFTESAGRSGKKISSGFSSGSDIGVRTTKSVKAVGCSILKLLIEQNQLILHDHQTIKEISTFSKKANSYEAESGCHDDLVMGLVLFAWLSDQQYFKDMTDINTLMRLREKTEDEWDRELIPFGFIETGQEEHEDVVELKPGDTFESRLSG